MVAAQPPCSIMAQWACPTQLRRLELHTQSPSASTKFHCSSTAVHRDAWEAADKAGRGSASVFNQGTVGVSNTASPARAPDRVVPERAARPPSSQTPEQDMSPEELGRRYPGAWASLKSALQASRQRLHVVKLCMCNSASCEESQQPDA